LSFDTKIFLKIYVWVSKWSAGWKLERSALAILNAMALCAIIPNYHSISDFRKQNPLGLKNLFKLFVSFLKDAELIGCEIIAIDGTKAERTTVRKNFNQKKIDRHLVYIDELKNI
jgi:transposase